ncbi:MAG: IS3 family transposase [Thermotogota bacterium]|nr:IS3 family transposase [Thermotogota bacterium]
MLCRRFGISRQAYYKSRQQSRTNKQNNQVVLSLIKHERKFLKRSGTRKIYDNLKPELEKLGQKIGRDKMHQLMKEHCLLVPKKKVYYKTTRSRKRFKEYPNLIKELEITKPEQVWVSDVTYIKVSHRHYYLHLVTDAYSKKIVGFNLSDNISAESSLKALKMAFSRRLYPNRSLIHHSDRGSNYYSDLYLGYLKENQIGISMTEQSDPYENAIAERVNGILKHEFGIGDGFTDYAMAIKEIKNAIFLYNTRRPHLSCDMSTPEKAHVNGRYKLKSWKKKRGCLKRQLFLCSYLKFNFK